MWLALVLFCCLQFRVAVRPAPDLDQHEMAHIKLRKRKVKDDPS